MEVLETDYMSPTGRANTTRRDPTCYLIKNVFVYMRGVLALLVGLKKPSYPCQKLSF